MKNSTISIGVKIYLIPYSMMDMGDSATRVWNALWWAQNPFFVKPQSGHPGWFYFMGPLIMITKEIYYTPILTMMVLMTISGIYIFKTTFILSDFRTALIAFGIFIFNPVITMPARSRQFPHAPNPASSSSWKAVPRNKNYLIRNRN